MRKWFSVIAPSKPRIIVTHGENGPRQALAERIRQRHALKPVLPDMKDTIEL